jgi:hypothetical protein
MSDGDTKIISVTQDYLILGKSTKNTEVRINVHGENYEASRRKVENMIRLMAYAENIYDGNVKLPNRHFEGDKEVPHEV